MKTVGIGIVGYGTVGQGTASVLRDHAEDITRRCGARLEVRIVCRRSPVAQPPAGVKVVSDWNAVVNSPEVDVIVETMGGTTHSREVVLAALRSGKPVVTANKNLLAEHGEELFALAREQHLPLGFEATVAGGIPVIRAIAEGTAGDRLRAIRGILNGTANYILTQMESQGLDFADCLAAAQKAGYAEPDPTFDVEGIDARDKLAILVRLAFGERLRAQDIPTMGISSISAVDIHYARRLSGTIRLIGAAESNGSGIEVSVRPWLVSNKSMLAKVEGVNNAVFLEGEKVGLQMFYGRGAGGEVTGVAVVSDLMEIGGDFSVGSLSPKLLSGFLGGKELQVCREPRPCSWYLRLTVHDQPGIIARTAEIIARHGINIDSVVQEPHMEKARLSFVITVEPVSEPALQSAVKEIDRCPFMLEPVLVLRMEA